MYVRVGKSVVSVPVYVHFPAPAKRTHESARTQPDDHQRDAELKPVPDPLRYRDAQHEHDYSDREERDGVADSPQAADQRGAQEVALLADDCRDGDDVVNFRRVLESEDEAEAEHGRRAQRSERRFGPDAAPPGEAAPRRRTRSRTRSRRAARAPDDSHPLRGSKNDRRRRRPGLWPSASSPARR